MQAGFRRKKEKWESGAEGDTLFVGADEGIGPYKGSAMNRR